MRDYIRLAGVLLIVCAVAAGLLGYTNAFTYDRIQEQIAKANDEARQEVLPNADEFTKIDDGKFAEIKSNPDFDVVQEVYEAKSGGTVIGYAVKVAPKGYGGPIEIIVGVNIEGKVAGIKVGNNNETPGLGKNAATPKFQNQYKDKSWDNEINVIKNGTAKANEIVAIAGSTITSRGVTKGVNQAMAVSKQLAGK